MAGNFISRGFRGRRREDPAVAGRIPPGQYLTPDFPVLSAGPTPRTPLTQWDFTIRGAVQPSRRWTWDEFRALPSESVTVDIHCVTKWSKLDTVWEGVSVDTLLDGVEDGWGLRDGVLRWRLHHEPAAGGYPGRQGLGGLRLRWQAASAGAWRPGQIVGPHLYFWKSAKWVRGLKITPRDRPGFWESLGYHDYGDPWREQRYQGD